jgi:uncharacterized membrane protein
MGGPASREGAALPWNTDADPDEKWLYSLAILFGIGLRVFRFWGPSLWLDELSTAWVATAHGWEALWQRCLLAHQPPIYFLVVKAFLLLGHNELFLRLPTIIFGLASLAALVVTMRRVLGTRAALYGGALYALNSRGIYHGQEARMYALAWFVTLVSIYFFVSLFEDSQRWRWLGYAAATLTVCYIHIIYICVLVGQTIVVLCFYYVLQRRTPILRRLLWTQMTLFLLAAPLTPLLFATATASRALGSFMSKPNVGGFLYLLTYPETGAAAALFVLILVRIWGRRQAFVALTEPETALVGVGIVYAAMLPCAAVLAAAGIVNILEGRYLLLPLLGAIISAAFVVARANDRVLRRGLWTFVLLTAILQGAIAAQIGPWVGMPREDWRGAIGWIGERYREGDLILMRSGLIEAKYLSLDLPQNREYLGLPLAGFYGPGGLNVVNLPWTAEELNSGPYLRASLRERMGRARQIIVVLNSQTVPWSWTVFEQWLQESGRRPGSSEKRQFQVLEVRVYRSPESQSGVSVPAM